MCAYSSNVLDKIHPIFYNFHHIDINKLHLTHMVNMVQYGSQISIITVLCILRDLDFMLNECSFLCSIIFKICFMLQESKYGA